jgi:uncharacterized membrane protein (Fun14 family)
VKYCELLKYFSITKFELPTGKKLWADFVSGYAIRFFGKVVLVLQDCLVIITDLLMLTPRPLLKVVVYISQVQENVVRN